ncbi:MAG: DUF4962 domain-containing protein [Burkholderiaceae bacterium]|nr:DUF4962 domain-containing protein [Burkholderiaceae bacterium]
MNLLSASILRGLLLLACTVSCPSYADWAGSSDPTVVHALPADGRIQPQNPPGFSWSRHSTNPASYVLEVQGATTQTFTSTRNWFLPSAGLNSGHYTWRVRPSTTLEWSSPRDFYIDATVSRPFLVPDNATLRQHILSRARPRGLTPEIVAQKYWSAAMNAERGPLLSRLSIDVLTKATTLPVFSDANWPLVYSGTMTTAYSAQLTAIRWAINDAGRQLEAAALLWRLTGDRRFFNEAVTRGNQLAALSPTGPTSFTNQDQGSRQIALTLIKAVDFLGADLAPAARAPWLASVAARSTDFYNDIVGSNGRLDQYPFDSHGATNLGMLTLISALALGDIPAASGWFDYAFRAYANSVSVWSGAEGGFSDGTAYAQYTADTALQIWQPLAAVSGVNLFTKPWANGFLQYLTHFVPPGTPSHVFGDQHEVSADVPTLKAFASRFATPTALWYVRNMYGTEDILRELEAPWPLPVKTVSTIQQPPNAALYPSIGWVAMHSNIADLARTSVYFKSSPYGSYSHSHGDQNSLVVNSGGRRLLIEAGYSDWYGSPLWRNWYHQTKSHNAITYDGGVGQKVDGPGSALSWNGKVTAFASLINPPLDYTSGDATAAYPGVLSSAVRQIWYLRALDLIVVRDKLAAPLPHVFEWNVHAPSVMVVEAIDAVRINNIDRSLCIKSLTPGTQFKKWTGPAAQAGKIEDHGAFTRTSATSAEFLMLLDVGCKKPLTSLTATSSGRNLDIGGYTISFPN